MKIMGIGPLHLPTLRGLNITFGMVCPPRFFTQEERNTFFEVDLKAQAQGVTDLGNHTR